MLDVLVFRSAADQYYMDKRKYPKTFDDLINGADPFHPATLTPPMGSLS